MVGIMFMVIKNVSAKSGRYFGEQQKNLGIENGFIEEMMSGQKVVKAFVHEEESMADFDKINEQLFESSYLANRYANVLMPILGNLGNVSFVLTALVGGLFALNGVGGLTIGGLMAFLQLNRSFNGPITQVSQQLNFVLMAISAEKAITLTEKSAKLAMNGSYGARYIGTFIILGVLMFFKIINPVTAVLPLFVPKIAYTVTAFKEKSDF